MQRDKQLNSVRLEEVLEKRRLEQALNAKEFAVLAGISYTSARGWFRLPGFPVLRGFVFWEDFVHWRKCQTQLGNASTRTHDDSLSGNQSRLSAKDLPLRAARILLNN